MLILDYILYVVYDRSCLCARICTIYKLSYICTLYITFTRTTIHYTLYTHIFTILTPLPLTSHSRSPVPVPSTPSSAWPPSPPCLGIHGLQCYPRMSPSVRVRSQCWISLMGGIPWLRVRLIRGNLVRVYCICNVLYVYIVCVWCLCEYLTHVNIHYTHLCTLFIYTYMYT